MSYWMILIWVGLFTGLTKLVLLATENKPEMVTTQYYEKGMKTDSILELARNAHKHQFQVQIDSNMPGFGGQAMLDSQVLSQNLKIQFYRPSNPKMDTALVLTPDAQGRFVTVFHPAKGLWNLRLTTTVGADTLLLEQDFVQK